jgi:methionyl-tRNA synthetase
MITIDDFKKLDIRVGKITEATAHPNADRLIVLKVDVGGGEIRQIVAGIRQYYDPATLNGRNIVVLCNLQSVTLRGVESQGMALAATGEQGLSLLGIDKDLPSGCKVS